LACFLHHRIHCLGIYAVMLIALHKLNKTWRCPMSTQFDYTCSKSLHFLTQMYLAISRRNNKKLECSPFAGLAQTLSRILRSNLLHHYLIVTSNTHTHFVHNGNCELASLSN
jgi:hypothetical protein